MLLKAELDSLHLATCHEEGEVVTALLQWRADVSIAEEASCTPLHPVVLRGTFLNLEHCTGCLP